MCFRLRLQQLGVLLFSVLLFGCTANQSRSEASADFSLVKNYSQHHYRRGANVASDPVNAATADYYNTQGQTPEEDNSDSLWAAIRQDFKIDHYPNNPEVQAQISWFVHNQGYLDRTALRAAPFMYYIYQEVKARHLPSELVLLPILESAYNPFVSSSAGAAGLWQLVPGTARTFGVRQDWWYDGRRDITASTKAALDYFSYLHDYFGGDWLLAIAAYDSGEGTVSSAIHRNARRGASIDFWTLHLPRETESYIPRLLALALIVNNPQAYDVHLPPINNAPYLGQVDISSQITLDKACQLAEMSLTELKILNPGYKKNMLSPHQPCQLLLPIDRIPVFKRNLLGESQTPSETFMIPENTSNNASNLAATPKTITQQAPTLAPDNEKNTKSESSVRPHLSRRTHTVKHGETLRSVARLYKISPVELAHWNRLSEHAHLMPGMQLTVFQKEHKPHRTSAHLHASHHVR